MNTLELTRDQKREIKQGRAKILKCAHCGCDVYYGSMNLISLGITNRKPTCSYECNKALGQMKFLQCQI